MCPCNVYQEMDSLSNGVYYVLLSIVISYTDQAETTATSLAIKHKSMTIMT